MGKWVIKVKEVTYHFFEFDEEAVDDPYRVVSDGFCNGEDLTPEFSEYEGKSITEKIRLDDNDQVVYHEYVD